MDKKRSNKKLGIMVAMAMGFSLAFGGTPTDALAATTTVASEGSSYAVNGTTMSYAEMVAAVQAAAKEPGSTVVIGDSATATAVSGEKITLGAGSTLTMKGSTNAATIVGGATASDLKADGTTVSGSNVNLASLEVSVTGGKTAKSALTGSVGELKVTGTGNMVFNSTSDSLKVDSLTATSGTKLTVSDGATVAATKTTVDSGAALEATKGSSITTTDLTVGSNSTLTAASGASLSTTNLVVSSGAAVTTSDSAKVTATNTTVASGATLSSAAGTLTTTNLTVESGATLAAGSSVSTTNLTVASGANIGTGTTVTADTVTVDASNSTSGTSAADALSNIKLTSSTGSAVAVTVENATTEQAAAITKAAETAAAAGGATVAVSQAVTVKGASDGTYTVGTTTGVAKTDLASQIAAAYTAGTSKVTLDKASTKALQGTDVTIPAGKTMVVADGTSSVSATAKTDAAVKLDGLSVTGSNGASFTDVTVDAGSNAVANNLTGVTADTVTVKSGIVKTSDVTATNLNLNGGTVDTAGTLNATTVTVNGGTVTTTTAGATPTIKATTVAVKSGTVAAAIDATGSVTVSGGTVAAIKADTVTVSGGTVAAGSTIAAKTVAVDGGSLSGAVVTADSVTVSNASALTGSTLNTQTITSTTALTDAEKAAIAAAVPSGKTATVTDSTGATTTITGVKTASIKVTAGSDGTYTVGTTTGVTKDKLATTIADAYTNGATTVTLDKASTQALQGTDVKIPAGKTMVVADSTGSVSATAKTDATVKLNGLSVSGTNGASFTDVTVDAGSNTVTNSLTGVSVDNITVKSGKVKTSDVKAGTLTLAGGNIITDGTLTADTLTVNGGTIESATVGATPTLKVTTLEINGGTLTGVKLTADTLKVSNVHSLAGTTIDASTVTVTGTLTEDEKAIIAAAVPEGKTVTVTDSTGSSVPVKGTQGSTPTPTPTAPSEATTKAIAAYQAAMAAPAPTLPTLPSLPAVLQTNPVTGDTGYMAQAKANTTANPFTTKISTASDVAGVSTAVSAYNTAADTYATQVSAYNTAVSAYKTAADTYNTTLTSASTGLDNITTAELANYNTANGTTYKSVAELQAALAAKTVSTTGLSSLQTVDKITDAAAASAASSLQSSIQEAGKTLAAPALAGARTMLVVSNVMAGNVANRTAELRAAGLASAIDDQKTADPERLWFQIKHGSMDVDDSSIYGKSKVKYTNYQLGYDMKLNSNDYIGGFMTTTAGDVSFDGVTASGTVDIENSFGMGLYGTHMLPENQYIDGMLQVGTMDNKYAGTKWNTRNFGAMVGYGVNIASSEKLTLNPYVRLSYDRITTDDATFSGNTVSADEQGNLAMKLGLNLKAASGLYGGLAYSRGLSGDYQSYVNGVTMPSSKNKANVVYLNLGYRGNVGPNTILDFSAEKTFVDYVGWNVAGRVNFLF